MMVLRPLPLLFMLALVQASGSALLASTAAVQARLDGLQDSGEPVVVHVLVALCDNRNQGIVPVPAALGDGQDPGSNLYWGALYGVRTHLTRSGYQLIRHASRAPDGVLERVVLSKVISRNGKPLELLLVADAWDGRRIANAIQQFLRFAAGRDVETVPLVSEKSIAAGGAAVVVVFVGHNGLMDFDLSSIPQATANTPERGSIVLACASKPYFLNALRQGGSHPLLLTTGLMAPKVYTLDSALTALLEGADSAGIHESAAQAYDAYQKCACVVLVDSFT